MDWRGRAWEGLVGVVFWVIAPVALASVVFVLAIGARRARRHDRKMRS